MSHDFILRLGEDGGILLPEQVREALGVGSGDEVILRPKGDDSFLITTQRRQIARARKRIRTYIKANSGLVDESIAERRAEAAKE